MYDRILVPLDGSPFGEQVLPLAAVIARRSGMALELVKVHRRHPVGYAQDTMLAALDLEARDRAASGAYLARTAARVAESGGLRVRTDLLDDPSPTAEVICGEAARRKAALVAMTTHGRTGLLRVVRGSVADGVLRHATVPVLLWKSDTETPAPATPPAHVLVALDGSTWAEMVLPAAAALARVLDARLTLLRVVSAVAAMVPEPAPAVGGAPFAGVTYAPQVDQPATERAIERAQAAIEHVAARVREEHPTLVLDARAIAGDDTAGAILRTASELGADLVAMTTHGRGASRLVVGSTVDRVIAGRAGATLLVRPTAPVPRR